MGISEKMDIQIMHCLCLCTYSPVSSNKINNFRVLFPVYASIRQRNGSFTEEEWG